MAHRGRKIARRIAESVTFRTISTLTVSPNTATVARNASQQYTVAGVNEYGESVPIGALDITWSLSDAAAGTISSTGLFTAGAAAPVATYQVRATHPRAGVFDEADAVVTL